MQEYDEEIQNGLETMIDDEDDELDLIALVSSNANDTNQYLVFTGSDGQYYAKNVAKIDELIVYKDIDIVKTHGNPLIVGTADIRGQMTTIVKFDQWFGNEVLDDSEYELVILTHYGRHRLGLVVKSVESIVNIPNEEMHDNTDNDAKTLFVTRVKIARENKICLVFDSDRMFLDIFDSIDARADEETKSVTAVASDKLILFADDSRVVRKMVKSLLDKLGLQYKIYENGKLLLDDLQTMEVDSIGLIVTDLEMPVMGGNALIDAIRSQNKYDKLNILVHTNMSNETTEASLLKSGVQGVIGKINMQVFSEAIHKYMH